jgi:arylsulfatase A-like enzyme
MTVADPTPPVRSGFPRRRRRIALAVAVTAAVAAFAVAAWRLLRPVGFAPANVVLVLVDTLRADHLGTYGYPRPTSPRVDRLAAESLVFEQARSVAPWTNPAIASIFTGRHPHAVLDPHRHAQAIRQALPKNVPTLASKLGEAGFRTLAFVDHPGISPGHGFARGFETFVQLYRELGTPTWGQADGDRLVDEVARHFPALAGRRFFVYVHLIFPHRPYDAPPRYTELFGPPSKVYRKRNKQRLIDAYDAEIRFTDDVVADLLAELERAGLRDDSWVIFTSDHGEGFWEHGHDEHGNSLFDELLRIPLVLAPPLSARVAPRRIETSVSLVDLHATVLEMAGVGRREATDGIEGRSLLRFASGWTARWAPPAPADVLTQQPHSGDVRGAALVRWPWKLIRRQERRRPPLQLYHLAEDPAERAERSAAEPDLVRRLDEALGRHLAHDRALLRDARADAEEHDLDAETIERLKALGYLN